MPIHFRVPHLGCSCAAILVLGESVIHLLPRRFSRRARSLECGDNPQLIEVTRDNKVVWAFTNWDEFGNMLVATKVISRHKLIPTITEPA